MKFVSFVLFYVFTSLFAVGANAASDISAVKETKTSQQKAKNIFKVNKKLIWGLLIDDLLLTSNGNFNHSDLKVSKIYWYFNGGINGNIAQAYDNHQKLNAVELGHSVENYKNMIVDYNTNTKDISCVEYDNDNLICKLNSNISQMLILLNEHELLMDTTDIEQESPQ